MHKIKLALLAIPLLLAGCSISFSTTANYDADYDDRFRKATEAIVKKSKEVEEGATKLKAAVRPQTEAYLRRHFEKADELVTAHTHAVERKLDHFDDYSKRRATLLRYTLALKARYDIVEATAATATAFPTGRILVTRPLAEGFDTDKEGYDSVLLGVLLHELIHVRDGHALEQWAAADGRRAWAADRALSGLAALASILPGLSITHDIQYPLAFGAAKELPVLSEFAADMGAYLLLEKAGLQGARYVAFLAELDASARRSGRPLDLLRHRVECLGAFARNSYQSELRSLAIGSEADGDDIILLQFPDPEETARTLDSPEDLARKITIKGELSHAERRNVALRELRRLMFTACAVRRSFPDAKIEGGHMSTPSFDVGKFIQYQ